MVDLRHGGLRRPQVRAVPRQREPPALRFEPGTVDDCGQQRRIGQVEPFARGAQRQSGGERISLVQVSHETAQAGLPGVERGLVHPPRPDHSHAVRDVRAEAEVVQAIAPHGAPRITFAAPELG